MSSEGGEKGAERMSQWLEHEAKAECLDLRLLRDQQRHEIEQLQKKVTELSDEAYGYAEQVENVRSRLSETERALRKIVDTWDKGSTQLVRLAGPIRAARMVLSGITPRDIAETMPEDIR